MTTTTPETLSIRTVIDHARGRGVTFAATRDGTGQLTVRWTPPRALTRDESRLLFRAGASALAALLDTDASTHTNGDRTVPRRNQPSKRRSRPLLEVQATPTTMTTEQMARALVKSGRARVAILDSNRSSIRSHTDDEGDN